MRVSELYIYPVKSLAGISVHSARVLEKGLEMDRRWMIIDDHQQFMTQREHPGMALIKTSIKEGKLYLHNGASSAEVELGDSSSKVTVWNDTFLANNSTAMANEWISDQLKTNCKLVSMDEDKVERRKMEKPVSFADGYPFLFFGKASMDDLNKRLSEPLSILRFRPNIVFEGGQPFEEDGWKDFSVGNVIFEGVKPCVRCVLTTIDPNTAEKGPEPLKTLATFRKKGNEIHVGLNAFSKTKGIISVGDHVTVKTRQPI